MDESFHTDCGGPYDLQREHTVSCYEAEPTSNAERAIIGFLAARPAFCDGKALLHIGVGNSASSLAFSGTPTVRSAPRTVRA